MAKISIADILKELGIEDLTPGDSILPPPDHDHFCGCGSCQDAFDSTLRMFEQISEHHCALWWIQIGAFAQAMGKASAQRLGDPYLKEYHKLEADINKRMVLKENWGRFQEAIDRNARRKAAIAKGN